MTLFSVELQEVVVRLGREGTFEKGIDQGSTHNVRICTYFTFKDLALIIRIVFHKDPSMCEETS